MDRDVYIQYVLASAQGLDSLYETFGEESLEDKERKKQDFIKGFKRGMKSLDIRDERYMTFLDKRVINNTFFMSYIRYEKRQNEFREEFERKFQGDFPKYIAYLKDAYPSMF